MGKKIKWTKEACHEEALKYNTRVEFYNKSSVAYTMSCRNKWIEDITKHMTQSKTPNHYWTKEKCHEEALKYHTKKEFSINSPKARKYAYKNGWLDEICLHMIKLGNRMFRCVYAYEFPDNHVYVGLTYNIHVRNLNRINDPNDQVTKHINKTQQTPIIKQITDYISVNEASKLENIYIENYKNDGWIILNKAKGGGIGGGHIIWDKNVCKIEALKYKTRSEFENNSLGAYSAARKNLWLDEICSHMFLMCVHWTKEMCIKEASKCKTKTEFRENSPNAYAASYLSGWMDEVTDKLIKCERWTKEKCLKEALKYETKADFIEFSKKAYRAAIKYRWVFDISQHMVSNKKHKGYWKIKRNCYDEGAKYKTKTEFKKYASGAYSSAKKNGWLNDIISNMNNT